MPNPVAVTVEGQQLGLKKPLIQPRKIELPETLTSQANVVTLRNLIHYLVQLEVDAFQDRQENRQLFRVLTAAQIEAGKNEGRIDPAEKNLWQVVNLEEAVRTAIQAFEDGLYFVFFNEQQLTSLDDAIQLTDESSLKFVRLVALAGG